VLESVEEAIGVAEHCGVHVEIVHFKCSGTDNWGKAKQALRMIADAKTQGEAMLRAAGLVNVTSYEGDHVPGDAIHEMGGARMGVDPRHSVLNGWSQAHDASNLYVTDGAQMASVSCVNPSLTFMALTARAADYAVKQLQAGGSVQRT